ncbi:hypothetical protein, partial [Pseudomonas syringae]|uniref:hypothetical protein n=1 Tax=Pseudomonas syringae TaxID=317 RepID=UPI00195766B7
MNLQDKQHLTTTQNLTHLTHPKKTTFPTPQPTPTPLPPHPCHANLPAVRCKISGWVWRPKEKTKIRSIAKQQILSACMSRYGGCAREIFGSAGVCLFA